MNKDVLVRFLIPHQLRNGKIEYRVETRQIYLPLKRGDRASLKDRLPE